jgi:hypothetical protein
MMNSAVAVARGNADHPARTIATLAAILCLLLARALAASQPAPAPAPTPQNFTFDHWHSHASEHFLVRFDPRAQPEHAQYRATLLERAFEQFHQTFSPADFQLAPPSAPMECLLFDSKDRFTGYAQQIDRVDMSWSASYYSARTNRIALFQDTGSESTAPILNNDPDPNDDTLAYGETDSPTQPASATARFRLARASTTHEAAHQLAFNSGLQRRGVMYPLWISEGLATNFEMLAPDQPFGPQFDNPVRRAHLTQAANANRLLPLDQFIATTRVPAADRAATDALYAQAWALFRFLFQHHRPQLTTYLQNLADAPPGRTTTAALRWQFVIAFGPTHTLNTQYQAWLNQQLESPNP